MGKQTELFPKPPRKPPVKRAHVTDAGNSFMDGLPYGAQFTCNRCNWISEWLAFATVTEVRKGIPCQKCNEVKS